MDRRGMQKPKDDGTRINKLIRAREVRVIGHDGAQLGIMPLQEALTLSGERGLDLVEVSPTARPPVCRIMDYGKFKYTQKKKLVGARRRQTGQQMKEVKLRPKTEEHDYSFKLRHVNRFLLDGAKVKVTVRFRGREMAHRDIGFEMLERIIKEVGELATVASRPSMEGRLLYMVLAPSSKAMVQKRAKDEERNKDKRVPEDDLAEPEPLMDDEDAEPLKDDENSDTPSQP